MKKFVVSLVCLLCSATSFAGNPVEVKSGDLSVLKEKAQALLEFDYSAATVGEKTLNEYLKGRGDDFVRDWPTDILGAASYFTATFNKKNKKGMQISPNESAAAYKIIVHVKNLDMGNGGSTFVPFASAKAGGVIMTGTIDIVKLETNEIVCNLSVDEVKGIGTVSEAGRLTLMYGELATKLCKLAK